MKNKWKKEMVDELKLKASTKTRESEGEVSELESYRDGNKTWKLAVEELRKEIEEIESRLKKLI
jgi:hypothetical protein